MRIVKWSLAGLFGLFAVLLGALVALYFATGGDDQVPATTTNDPTLPRIEAAGLAFHGQTFGSPQNPAVIVLHGGPGGDYRSLLPLKALADTHHVVFYDQRGAGLSPRVPDAELTLAQNLADLDAIIDTVSPDRPVALVGHSWGAMLATAYLGHAPGKIARAVLMEPGYLTAAEGDAWSARAKTMMAGPRFWWTALVTGIRAQHIEGPDPDAREDFLVGTIVADFASHPDNPYHCPDKPWAAPSWRFGARASSALMANASPADIDGLAAAARTYPGPVLLLAGACDTWIGGDLQARHAALFANATLKIIPGAGHDMVTDNPDATLAAINAFLTP